MRLQKLLNPQAGNANQQTRTRSSRGNAPGERQIGKRVTKIPNERPLKRTDLMKSTQSSKSLATVGNRTLSRRQIKNMGVMRMSSAAKIRTSQTTYAP